MRLILGRVDPLLGIKNYSVGKTLAKRIVNIKFVFVVFFVNFNLFSNLHFIVSLFSFPNNHGSLKNKTETQNSYSKKCIQENSVVTLDPVDVSPNWAQTSELYLYNNVTSMYIFIGCCP